LQPVISPAVEYAARHLNLKGLRRILQTGDGPAAKYHLEYLDADGAPRTIDVGTLRQFDNPAELTRRIIAGTHGRSCPILPKKGVQWTLLFAGLMKAVEPSMAQGGAL